MSERLKCPTCTRTIAERAGNRFIVRDHGFILAEIEVGYMNCPHMDFAGMAGHKRVYNRCPGKVELLALPAVLVSA